MVVIFMMTVVLCVSLLAVLAYISDAYTVSVRPYSNTPGNHTVSRMGGFCKCEVFHTKSLFVCVYLCADSATPFLLSSL